MKKLITILFLTFLQSCSEGYIESHDLRLLNNSQIKDSAIVLTKISAKSISTGAISNKFGYGFTQMNWCKDDEKKQCKENVYFNPYTRKKINNEFGYYAINPGKYYLDEIKEQRNHPENFILFPIDLIISALVRHGTTIFTNVDNNFNTSLSGWNTKLKAPNFASFEVSAGEIVYIGDLHFTFTKQKYWSKGKIDLEVQDNYDKAVKYFRSSYPEYKDRHVIKRLASPGVFLDNYDAGFFW